MSDSAEHISNLKSHCNDLKTKMAAVGHLVYFQFQKFNKHPKSMCNTPLGIVWDFVSVDICNVWCNVEDTLKIFKKAVDKVQHAIRVGKNSIGG